MRKVKFFAMSVIFLLGTSPAAQAQSLGVCWANYNSQVQACRGNTVCEGFASMTLSTCLQALVQVDQ
ncbi:hypothetical protein J2X47_002958 [Sphingomonas sp. BE270]|jgi:hypothetical protein|nr:hypothetical protein [Sphingomonas sp. BE137]MDR7258768.1 hypothetical protein [Sphingomonas sp. BE270]